MDKATYMKKYHEENKDKKKVANKKYRDKNIEAARKTHKEYKSNNRAYFNNLNAVRRAKTSLKNISEKEKEKMVMLYYISKKVSVLTGVVMHVDHIIPICKGGKHTINNLQVITAEANMTKGGR